METVPHTEAVKSSRERGRKIQLWLDEESYLRLVLASRKRRIQQGALASEILTANLPPIDAAPVEGKVA